MPTFDCIPRKPHFQHDGPGLNYRRGPPSKQSKTKIFNKKVERELRKRSRERERGRGR